MSSFKKALKKKGYGPHAVTKDSISRDYKSAVDFFKKSYKHHKSANKFTKLGNYSPMISSHSKKNPLRTYLWLKGESERAKGNKNYEYGEKRVDRFVKKEEFLQDI